jgi:hypothetical protein
VDFPFRVSQTGEVNSGDGTAQPLSVTPGDRPAVPLEAEPFLFFHAPVAGGAVPGLVQPAPGLPLLEEEPAIWPELSA